MQTFVIDGQEVTTYDRVECKIHGAWFWMPLAETSADKTTAKVVVGGDFNYPHSLRELPIVPQDKMRFTENGTALKY